MSLALALALLLFLSAVFSGSETGFYGLSRLRIEAEAQEGRLSARLVRLLIKDEIGLLITLLIANNLALELLTHLVDSRLSRFEMIPTWGHELVATAVLTPFVFFLAELVPKDLFLRRADRLFMLFAPLIGLARIVFLPLSAPLRFLAAGLERLLAVQRSELTSALGREQVLELLREGRRSGALSPEAEKLALNVLDLRKKTVGSVMVSWDEVETVDLDRPEEERRRRVLESGFSRLPAVRRTGAATVVDGYVLQLDVLGEVVKSGGPTGTDAHLRPITVLPPELPVDRALARLRLEGQRMALVGETAAPAGIVTLKDLVQTISGDLGGW